MFLLDLIRPKILFEKTSDFNGDVTVIKFCWGETKLFADQIVQSTYIKNRLPDGYWRKVLEITKFNSNPKNALVLGLGGGTIQRLVSEAFELERIDSVEIDPIMLEAAQQFFGLAEVKNHKVVVGEVTQVLANPGAYGLLDKYDLVISDVFIGSFFKNRFDSKVDLKTYALTLKSFLASPGFVLFNSVFLRTDPEGIKHALSELKGVFPDLEHFIFKAPTVSDNHLFYSKTS